MNARVGRSAIVLAGLMLGRAGLALTAATNLNAALGNETKDSKWALVATTFVVTNTNDSGAGSLRQAIADANANAGADTITFAAGLTGTITVATSGALLITDSVTITGPGVNVLSVSGTSGHFKSRVFEINSGINVAISGLTIHKGSTTGPFFGAGFAGGIFNQGNLTLNSCVVSDNKVRGGQNPVGGSIAGDAYGGGIVNSGTLTLNNCVVRDNSITGISAFGAGIAAPPNVSSTLILNNTTVSGNTVVAASNGSSSGGGISVNASGTATVKNSTFSGNLVTGDTNGVGGGIASAGTLSVSNSTITGNIVSITATGKTGQGGGLTITAGAATLSSSIVADNYATTSSRDVQGALAASGSFNLIGDGTGMSGLSNGTNSNQVGTAASPINPLLGALSENGGPTPTHVLLLGSPAIDKGTANALTTDQRGAGFSRTVNEPAVVDAADGTDIGAFEIQTVSGDPCSAVVTNTNDSGAGSLREAINCSNAAGGRQTISFAIPGGGPHTIAPSTALPPILDPVTIDGYTQAGSNSNTLAAGTNAILQIVISYANVASSLSFADADRPELIRDGESVFDVQSDAPGSSGTILRGLVIQPGTSLTTGAKRRQGIFLRGTGGHTVEGCFIGTNAAGTAAATSNTEQTGIFVLSDGNTIGGATVAARNIVSGNPVGIRVGRHGNLEALRASSSVIQNNLIGTNAAGTGAIPNGPGILVAAASGTRISDNLISGNTLPVPSLEHTFVNETAGIVVVPFNAGGFTFFATSDELRGNVTDTEISGNRIGSSVSGDGALPNRSGIWISGVSPVRTSKDAVVDLRIGTPQAGNLISGNQQGGIFGPEMSSADLDIVIRNNRIGTNADGTSALANGGTADPAFAGDGINIFDGFNGVQIGGAGDNEGNLISGNARHGIYLIGAFSLVQGNRIGTDAAGMKAIGNGGDGLRFENAVLVTIGGPSPSARNLISGNDGNGIAFFGATTASNFIQGNYIGTDATGAADLGNALDGVLLSSAPRNQIGGFAAGESNLISGNSRHGIQINGAGANDNEVLGNMISGNSGDGVAVVTGVGNKVLSNTILGNGGLGIDLEDDGPTPNDLGDADTGGNARQNYPMLTSVSSNSGNITVQGSLNSIANTTYKIEFFASDAADPSGYGEGSTFLAAVEVTTDNNGNAAISAVLAPPSNQSLITATATDSSNSNTSEFSLAMPITVPSGQLLNIATRLRVNPDPNQLIAGLIITGSEPKKIIVRAIGPSLSAFFSGVLANPTLELFQGNTLVTSNNDWKENGNQSVVEATGIPPSNDLESAIVQTLAPGAYTAIMRGVGGGTGIGLVEVYDLDQSANSRLGNIATRGFVDTDNNVMIGGFIIGGNGQANTRVVVRAIGPSLSAFGINGVLEDPVLELKDANGATLVSNDDWMQGQAAEIQQLGLAPGDSRESALLASLPQGNYTAIVRGKSNSTGVGLVEVYNVQ
jgi:hypothetical protein